MLELNKIYQENALITMRERIPDNFIDLTVSSPPYDKLRDYKGFKFPFKHIARNLYRITKPGGVVVWVVADQTINGSESGTAFRQALFFMECGFRLHDTQIYVKENFIPLTHNRYEQGFEYMFVFSKGKPKTFNPIMIPCKGAGKKYNLKRKGYCETIKEGAQRRRDQEVITNDEKIKSNLFAYTLGSRRTGHPAPFPKGLARDQITTWSNENDIVYDPFGGSGSTAKEAHELNRK
ncbi:MAG: site-specific DNA-methyltransferase [Chitinophagales bacterium]